MDPLSGLQGDQIPVPPENGWWVSKVPESPTAKNVRSFWVANKNFRGRTCGLFFFREGMVKLIYARVTLNTCTA